MGSKPSGTRLAVAAAALLAALGALAWLVLQASGDGSGARERSDAPTSAVASSKETSARRTRDSETPTPDAAESVVEVEDGAFPEGATLTIRGTVRDTAGRPIADADVSASAEDQRFLASDPCLAWSATTGDDGSYELTGLEPRLVWSLSATGRNMASPRDATAVVATPKRLDLRYDFVLAAYGSIDVAVLDEKGAPVDISRNPILVSNEAAVWGSFFRPEELAPGRYLVHATSPGRAYALCTVDVAAGVATRVEIRLEKESEIAGMLVNADGEPMRRFEVTAYDVEGPSPWYLPRATTGADGSFRIGGLRRARYDLRLDELDFAVDGGAGIDAPADGVRLQVRRGSKVTFRVVYPSDFTDTERSQEADVTRIVRGSGQRISPRWDGDDCTLRVPGGEEVELVIAQPGCVTVRRTANVRPDGILDLGAIRLDREEAVNGRVVDANGRPVRNASVLGRFGGTESRSGTDAGGWFWLIRLGPGEGVVTAIANGFAQSQATCQAGRTEPLVLTLARGGRLVVRATDAAGRPLDGAAVKVTGTGAEPEPAKLDPFGEYATRLAAGRWRVEVAGCAPVDADVREEGATTVRLRAK